MAITVADEKKNLRAILIDCRDALTTDCAAAASNLVQRNFLASDFYRSCPAIVLYAAIGNEVSTDLILADALPAGRAVFYPRIDKVGASGTMTARRVRAHRELQRGAYGILEPPESAAALEVEEFTKEEFTKIVVCVPGVAFGVEGQRLGRGGGHYDRFIGALGREAISVGLAYSFQLLGQVPETELDRRLNFIATESAVHRAGAAPRPAREAQTKEVHPGGSNHLNPGTSRRWRGLFHLGNNEAAQRRR
jgi:5-formyltetrahydrofolate cyclo-ligase